MTFKIWQWYRTNSGCPLAHECFCSSDDHLRYVVGLYLRTPLHRRSEYSKHGCRAFWDPWPTCFMHSYRSFTQLELWKMLHGFNLMIKSGLELSLEHFLGFNEVNDAQVNV
ncbi:unnamed protein product [Chondrus crispus]|uniref:Uncharacterized protein n=1 Tax=Chondrus crispus TaxID=2769 RepID=R7QJE1_CHOCR|nr:unnamed protein product [Chondrus crispus]CDF37576.1 unnamed protein product [Chondrus crispus]|eukprot:XP_005717447.1 unnamed protein product [Chondrus crispus]